MTAIPTSARDRGGMRRPLPGGCKGPVTEVVGAWLSWARLSWLRLTILSMEQPRTCAKCGQRPVGAGEIMCPDCLAALTHQFDDYWRNHPQAPQSAAGSRVDHSTRNSA